MLSDPETRAQLSGAFELKLMIQCGEITQEELNERLMAKREVIVAPPLVTAPGTDVLVNKPASDTGGTTQSETSIRAVGNHIVAAWNDAGEGFGANGFSGFGFSSDGGATWKDGGPFPNGPGPDRNSGDPSLAYSVRDGAFYYAALSTKGLSMWKSTDNGQTFQYVGPIHVGNGDDKELIEVDNSPSSPFFGRIYCGWTNFSLGADRMVVSFSNDGGATWSAPVSLPGSGTSGQGMWPAVAPNGHVFFAFLQRSFSIGGLQSQRIYKSVNGGASWTAMTNIASNQKRPENVTASTRCFRQALNGDIRNLSSPQICITPFANASAGYIIHATYPYDSDGGGADESNVFYRKSKDGGVTWSGQKKLNKDGTKTDQWYPAIGCNCEGVIAVSWYDRRHDTTNNLNFDRYVVCSLDNGKTWGPNTRVSDVSSPVSINNPHFDGLSRCYHGDYDQTAVDHEKVHMIWSDDRRVTGTGPNPDVYYDFKMHNGPFDPVVGTWRGTHKLDGKLGGGTLATRDLHLYCEGTFGRHIGDFTLNIIDSSTRLTQGAWNRRSGTANKRIRVGSTEIDNADFNEAYAYTNFKLKGLGLNEFKAHFVNTFFGPPPTGHIAGIISGSRISNDPQVSATLIGDGMAEVVDVSKETASGSSVE